MRLKVLPQWQDYKIETDYKSETLENQPRKPLVTTSLLVVGDCWVLLHLRTEMDGSRVAWCHSLGCRKGWEWFKWMSAGRNRQMGKGFWKIQRTVSLCDIREQRAQKEEN